MRQLIRKLFRTLPWLLLALLLLCAIGLYFIQTSTFRDRVRDGVVAALENASGGRVELNAFDFDWRTFRARFDNLTIHGNEPVGAQPLLHVASLRVDLKLVSLFAHDIDVLRIVADHPAINLLIRPDGRSNLPEPAKSRFNAVDELLSLKVDHFDTEHGSLQLNTAQHSFALRGDDLHALLKRERGNAAYDLTIASPRVALRAGCCRDLSFNIQAEATLSRDILQLKRALITSEGATLEASGSLSHFLQPVVAVRFFAHGPVDLIAKVTPVSHLDGGTLSLEGAAHYDTDHGLTAEGVAQSRRVTWASPRIVWQQINATSRFYFSNQTLTLRNAVAHTLGGVITGQLTLRNASIESFTADLASIDSRQLAAAARLKAFPWSASITGRVNGNTATGYDGQLDIAPGPGTNPLSGNISFSARSIDDLHFKESHLSGLHTQLVFAGSRNTGWDLTVASTDLNEIQPALAYFRTGVSVGALPVLENGGSARFAGRLSGLFALPIVQGNLSIGNFEYANRQWDRLQWQGEFSPATLSAQSLTLDAKSLHVTGTGQVGLQNGRISQDSSIQFHGNVRDAVLSTLFPSITHGTLSSSLNVSGKLRDPQAQARITARHLDLLGECLARAEASVRLTHGEVYFDGGRAEGERGGTLSFQGSYAHRQNDWQHGILTAAVQSRRLTLVNLASAQIGSNRIGGLLDMDTRFSTQIAPGSFELEQASGNFALTQAVLSGEALGSLHAQLATENRTLKISLAGDLLGNKLTGTAGIHLTTDHPVEGDLQFDRIPLSTVQHFLGPRAPALDGFAEGSMKFAGLLSQFGAWRSTIQLAQLQLAAPPGFAPQPFALHNAHPVLITLAGGVASFPNVELLGPDTKLSVQGSLGYLQKRLLQLRVDGSVGLAALNLFAPTLQAAGQSKIEALVGGTLDAPSVTGKAELQNGSIDLRDSPNSLSQLTGLVTFDRDRATMQTLNAQYGGGHLTAGGFVSFGHNAPLSYHLDAHADRTRLRNASGISMTANADLRLSGTTSSSLLSGTATISRIVFNPSTDVGNALSAFASAAPLSEDRSSFLGKMQLDVAIQNAPNLQLSTALSRDVEADVDLHLHGTPDRPILLGSVSVDQGDIRVFGSRYTINRGQVSFLNAARLEPVLDLDLETQARGINVDITISGTLNRLNITYRSDPPLQPRDIIALLTVGRTPEQSSNVQSTQATDTPSLQSGASSVLGQAISPQSSRLAKLFGITNIKIDPLVQGITNIRQSRLTLEQQISRNITITYVTNLEQTSEQIFRLEWAINRQYSVVAVRDDNGEFGIDFQYRKRFK